MIPLPHFMRTRARVPKFLSRSVSWRLLVLPARHWRRADDSDTTLKLTVASSQATTLAWVGAMHTLVVPELDRRLAARGSAYRIRWTEAYGGSLYKYENTLEAIEIGLTDMGWVGTLWELSKLPLQNVTFYAPFASDDFRLVVDIVNEMHRTVPAMTEAWTAQNVKFLGASALDTYHLMTTFPVRIGRRLARPQDFGAGAVGRVARGHGRRRRRRQPHDVLPADPNGRRRRRHYDSDGRGAEPAARGRAVHHARGSRQPGHGRARDQSRHVEPACRRKCAPCSRSSAPSTAGPSPTSSRSATTRASRACRAKARRSRSSRSPRNRGGSPRCRTSRGAGSRPPSAAGIPAGVALRAYMNALRARGAQPLRDWDAAP